MERPSETLPSISDAQNDIFSCRNDTGRGSIAERRAAKCGFRADRINTPRFRSISPLTSPAAARSPLITIPPGVSPTALLDSPVMLPNCQPSPTTGSFPFPLMNYGGSVRNTHSGVVDNGASEAGSFEFKPYNCVAFSEHQANNTPAFQQVGLVEPPMDFEFSLDLSKGTATDSFAKDAAITGAIASISKVQIGDTDVSSNQRSLPMESALGENIETHHLEEDKGTFSATGNARNSEDGYNWRKYGQKQVKGSEYPRSYYKCTHSNCLVKKKIERSHDGQITEIIYKGAHNHPKPQPNRRAQVGSTSAFDDALEMNEASETSARVDVGSVWNNLQPGSTDGLERTPSTSVVTELSDPLSITQGKSMQTFESVGAQELSSRFVCNDDDDDDRATEGSESLGVDADFEESESKRRKIDSCMVETNLSSRAVREPRVVVQIESEVDILDDGYRWRKYGQKVVKGNPNPRSYYKCTSAGCSVRKHVERASHNLKFVITTYEGKHNHEVPAAKNSNNLNSNGSSLPHTNAHPASTDARNSNRIKFEAQIQDYAPGFDRKPAFNIGYWRPSFAGNFSDKMKLGASSTYPLKYPALHPTMPCGSSEFNNLDSVHSGSIASYVPDFQISLPSSLHKSANPSLDGVAFNCNNGKPANQGQLFMSGQQLVLPKLEQRDDDHFDAGKATIDHVNGSLSSSVYQGIMGNFTS